MDQLLFFDKILKDNNITKGQKAFIENIPNKENIVGKIMYSSGILGIVRKHKTNSFRNPSGILIIPKWEYVTEFINKEGRFIARAVGKVF